MRAERENPVPQSLLPGACLLLLFAPPAAAQMQAHPLGRPQWPPPITRLADFTARPKETYVVTLRTGERLQGRLATAPDTVTVRIGRHRSRTLSEGQVWQISRRVLQRVRQKDVALGTAMVGGIASFAVLVGHLRPGWTLAAVAFGALLGWGQVAYVEVVEVAL